uniref:MULE transposase domain-containing protein n=1 Tax=Globodera rostochiensis TaxID=31243 RepID=A0A914HZB6_GLORO
MNIEKLVRCKIEGLQKMNKHYIAVEQSSVREEETNQSMLHRDSSITSVGDENLEPVEFELGKTIRGKECAWYNGFRYLRNAAHSLSWRCSDRKCKGTLRILERRDDKAFGHVGQHEHNHLPDPARKEADSKKLSLKRKIQEEPSAKPSKIFGQVRKDVNCEVFVEMGTDIALRHMMRREKASVFGNVNSANPLTINLSDALIIKDGESMLLYDSRISRPNQGDVVLVFAIPKCTPAQWKQCLVIGASVRKRMVVCVHALLPGKHRKYYEEVLQVIKQAVSPSFPYAVLLDFEQSEIKAVNNVFKNTSASGCMFHYGQSLVRKWKDLGLEELYGRVDAARSTLRGILSLPLIPPEHVRRAFYLLVDQSPDGLQSFMAYFCRVYVGMTRLELNGGANAFGPAANQRGEASILFNNSGRSLVSNSTRHCDNLNVFDHSYSIQFGFPSPRPSTPSMPSFATTMEVLRWEIEVVRQPLYPIRFWNVHQQAASALARTNNALESSHLHFSRNLTNHPALSDFLRAVSDDADKQHDIYRSARLHRNIQLRHKKFVLQERAIMTTLQDAEYETDIDLLQIITLLGLQIKGYLVGLHARRRESEFGEGSTIEQDE